MCVSLPKEQSFAEGRNIRLEKQENTRLFQREAPIVFIADRPTVPAVIFEPARRLRRGLSALRWAFVVDTRSEVSCVIARFRAGIEEMLCSLVQQWLWVLKGITYTMISKSYNQSHFAF